MAQAALVLFGLTPVPYNFVFLFFNGLPLGMVFGLVLGYLEGRRQTEALTAGLCASFILADGLVKSVGAWLLAAGISEFWMPSAAGALFLPPLLAFAWMLSRIPPPDPADVLARSARMPMSASDRWEFFRRYAGGLALLIVAYLLTTVLRSLRADFAPEIWEGLGWHRQPGIFVQSEALVGLGAIAVTGASVLIRNNRRAFFTAMGASVAGFLLVVIALMGHEAHALDGFAFMVLVGLGLYIPYVAVHTTIFERLIAMTRDRGNIGYLLYLADAFGYLGYVAVMLGKGAWSAEANFLAFFTSVCWGIAGASMACLGMCWIYFARRTSLLADAKHDAPPAADAV